MTARHHILTRAQCRAARAWFGWSQSDLSERTGVGLRTINRWEKGGDTSADSLLLLRAAFEAAGGVAFEPDGSIALTPAQENKDGRSADR